MNLNRNHKGKYVIIKKLNFNNKKINHMLRNIGIDTNNIVQVLDYNQNNKILHLKVFNTEYAMREKDCSLIDVTEIKK